MGNIACSTSQKTIDCLYEVSSHAGIVPDTYLDGSLVSLLSLNSSRALETQFSSIQQNLTQQQMSAFNQDLQAIFGNNTRVSYGGVGVVALALSVLFEVLAHHQLSQSSPDKTPLHPKPDPIRRIFLADGSSEIGSIVSEFFKQVPGAVNDQSKMSELLETYERKLHIELMDLYGRMVVLKNGAISSAGMKQWVSGAALHIHMFLHRKRLTNTTAEEEYSESYLRSLEPLVKTYTRHLHQTVKETPATGPGSRGLLVVGALGNTSHEVQHRACESATLQRALVGRFLAGQDLQGARGFFQRSLDQRHALLGQRTDFRLRAEGAQR